MTQRRDAALHKYQYGVTCKRRYYGYIRRLFLILTGVAVNNACCRSLQARKIAIKINFVQANGATIAELAAEAREINNAQDALDLMANCAYQGARKIVIHENQVTPDFFDLKTGVAGEILQKFSTYQVQLAIVGDHSRYSSKSLRDFIYESNKMGRIFFVSTVAEAREKLAAN